MSKYFCNGKLTVRAAMYFNALCISLVMGFSAPITTVYFLSHVTPSLVASFSIVLKLCGIIVSYIKQSEIAVRWISKNFVPLMIGCEMVFMALAAIGEMHPEVRYIGYNLICVVGVKLLQVVQKDNIANCLKGSAITSFTAKCDTWALVGSFVGAGICSMVLTFQEISVTICMIIEFIGCSIGHGFQVYINKRIRKDIRPELQECKVTFVDAINDVCRRKRKNIAQKVNDSIFDQ